MQIKRLQQEAREQLEGAPLLVRQEQMQTGPARHDSPKFVQNQAYVFVFAAIICVHLDANPLYARGVPS
jgi:hypothetical protein